MELFQLDDDQQSVSSELIQQDSQLFMVMSTSALFGNPSPKSMCMSGVIQHVPVGILIDSGSSHTFVSEAVAAQLVGVSDMPVPVRVQMANGQLIQCSKGIPRAEWSMAGYSFQCDLRVLPLSSYDMIIGLDWLDMFSPMKVHWKQKWLSITYSGTHVVFFGEHSTMLVGSVVQLCVAQQEPVTPSKDPIPSVVQKLIDEFAIIFALPSELPPQRSCDHSIPLIEGAAPVAIRPYRFAPVLKDEVEKQVKEMLASGIVQKSNSPFSSSVLLVKKKDNSWRFCVDYRHLNAITVKGKYPVLVIDELLDELSTASWFSSLDLRSGFHQIRLKSGEEFKTAFQTHCGHFEFKVMAFGLTRAPGTFQSAMNTSLEPFLRKFVLFFFMTS